MGRKKEAFDAGEFARNCRTDPANVVCGQLSDPAFVPGYIQNADHIFQRLQTEVPWKDKYWHLIYKLPQKTFHYSERKRKTDTNPVLEDLIRMVETLHNAKASDAWCNLYRTGEDHVEYHQDQYGEHLTTLSFGSSRTFLMRHNKTGQVARFNLSHGDVYTWSPETDAKFEHSIPADLSVTEPRISIVVWTQPPGSGL